MWPKSGKAALNSSLKTGRPYLNTTTTTTTARRSLSLFRINFGTMEFDPPPPPPGNLEALALHGWRFLYSDGGQNHALVSVRF